MDLVGELVRRLENRPATGDPAQRRIHDEEIAAWAARAASSLYQQPTRTGAPVPKRVATAMGLAVLCAPHFVATLPTPVRGGTPLSEGARRAPDLAPLATNEVLERSLGLSGWEIDELREEVDRRAGRELKLIRAVDWMWSYFHLTGARSGTDPDRTLTRILFPGTREPGPELVRRGGHLYLRLELEPADRPAALYLPWLAPDPALGPTAFRSRSVDAGLRQRLCRGIGSDDDEISELLEGMVALIPLRDSERWLASDQWRTHGYAGLTDLGTPYSGGDWLVRALPADAADWRAWLRPGPDGPVLKGTPAKVFDALALPRVAAMTRLLYAATLAFADRDGVEGSVLFRSDDVDLFDVPCHVRAVLAPLLVWAGRTQTHRLIARELGAEPGQVARVFGGLQDAWQRHASTSWWGPPGSRTPSIQTLLLEHLLVLNVSVRHLLRIGPDPRGAHGDVALLFAAHYLREARVERLWLKALSDCAEGHPGKLPPPEDILGAWFWPAWSRILDEMEKEPPPAP